MKAAIKKIKGSPGQRKICLLITLTLLAWPQTARADVASGFYLLTLPFCLIVVFIEAFYFSLVANVLGKRRIRFRRILWAIIVANFITYMIGMLLPFTDKGARGHGLLVITLIGIAISAFIEWIVYLSFFEKYRIGRWNLLRISFVGNAFTHALIALILRYGFFG